MSGFRNSLCRIFKKLMLVREVKQSRLSAEELQAKRKARFRNLLIIGLTLIVFEVFFNVGSYFRGFLEFGDNLKQDFRAINNHTSLKTSVEPSKVAPKELDVVYIEPLILEEAISDEEKFTKKTEDFIESKQLRLKERVGDLKDAAE
ncbi:hypothetical protein [Vibrio crassostreae]|uniref:hypothetical protein n=1 Tax=Vibrio crassostreae TaxID=246167 RepID=UPI001B30B91C|nr:hypothetical protein [Vibrio crassostreae]